VNPDAVVGATGSASRRAPSLTWPATVLLACAAIACIGTGAYTMLPGAAYALVGLACTVLALENRFVAPGGAGLDARLVAGVLLLDAAFMLHGVVYGLEPRRLAALTLSLGLLALSRTLWGVVLDDVRTGARHARVAVLVAVAVLLAAQLAELAGMIDRRGLGGSEDAELTVRPGGFLNPNMTAAIALVLAFVASRLSTGARDAIHLACLLVASIVVVLAQSRAGLLALGVHVGCLAWRRPAVLVAVGVAGVAAVAWIGADALLDVAGLVEHLLDRFSRDNSSDERLVVLELGMAAIDERPWFGHGYRHLEHVFGRSAHNEFVETTVNFGFVGLAVALVGVTLILLPASVHLLVVCVAPSVLFSHNFLDTVELQACLGLALAVDRSGRGR
jgi:hypothetical protein